ncbi:MAG: LysM peptidoglycan-binding domain-containing protein [Deltaproteobacteria bacterium]|nr:LysM peptidoglycan-binding domain-containing protein [Deltaproteobacteria bacterium]
MKNQKGRYNVCPGLIIATLVLVFLLSGCAEISKRFPEASKRFPAIFPQEKTVVPEKQEPVAVIPEPEASFVHIVTWPGESLSVISKWYTGKITNWRAIADSNPQLDPDRIYIGDEVVIPDELLITEKEMPKSFVKLFTVHPKPSAPAIEKRPEEPVLTAPVIEKEPEKAESIAPALPEAKNDKGEQGVKGEVPPPAPEGGEEGGDGDAFKLFGPKE